MLIDWFQSHPVALSIVSWLIGSITTLIANYLKLAGDVSYIKGQLSFFVEKVKGFDEHPAKLNFLEIEATKQHGRIDLLTRKMSQLEILLNTNKGRGIHG